MLKYHDVIICSTNCQHLCIEHWDDKDGIPQRPHQLQVPFLFPAGGLPFSREHCVVDLVIRSEYYDNQ